MKNARPSLAVALVLALAAPARSGETDLTDAENEVVRALEKIRAAEERFKESRKKLKDEEPVYGTFEELVAARLAEESWAKPEGWTVAVTVAEEFPHFLFFATAAPAAKDGRHFSINQGGVVYVTRKPVKVDAKSMESFTLPPERGGGTAVASRLTKKEQAERDARRAKAPLASETELEVLDVVDSIEKAEVLMKVLKGRCGTIEQLVEADYLVPSVAGELHGYTFKVLVIEAKGTPRDIGFDILATPKKPGPGARHFLKAESRPAVFSEKPIEPDATGAAPAGLEAVTDMVEKTLERLTSAAGPDSPSEYLALRSLRAIKAAQDAHHDRYVNAAEKGLYGTWEDLVEKELLAKELKGGKRYGYVFTSAPSSKDPTAAFFVLATPEKKGTGARTLFVNQKGEVACSKEPVAADPATCDVPKGMEPYAR